MLRTHTGASVRCAVGLAAILVLGGCGASPSPSPTTPESVPPTSAPVATTVPTPVPGASPTPAPPLSLPSARAADARRLRVDIQLDVPPTGRGTMTVSVTNLSTLRIREIVLRWPTDLWPSVELTPFVPTPGRICSACPPLRQEWSKWVVGPGELGEPAGTTSLGWGPLDPGVTLVIPIQANRVVAGPIAFDLQFLTGEAMLQLEGGGQAWLRVGIP